MLLVEKCQDKITTTTCQSFWKATLLLHTCLPCQRKSKEEAAGSAALQNENMRQLTYLACHVSWWKAL